VSEHAGAARWLTIHDELLRGVAHALSNRVATIDGASYMLSLDGADVAGQAATLRGETGRLEALLHALRALPRGTDSEPEPTMPADAVQGALALHAHHGALRDVPCDIDMEADVPPAYADPTALQHALLVAITAARCMAGVRGRVTLRVRSHADVVEFCAVARHGAAPAGDAGAPHARDDAEDAGTDDHRAIDWLLGAHGGRSVPGSSGVTFTVPTLTAARSAQRQAAGNA